MEVDWHLTGKTGANSAARKRELDEAANDYLDNHAQWEQSRGLVGTRS